MRRDPGRAEHLPDPVRLAARLPIGVEGGYFVGGSGFGRQTSDESVVDVNQSPGLPSMRELVDLDGPRDDAFYQGMRAYGQATHEARMSGNAQPSLWCHWIPIEDGRAIAWNGDEKFAHATEWMAYLLRHFLVPWGHLVNGRVDWQGAEDDDFGTTLVWDSRI